MYIQDLFLKFYDYRPFQNASLNKILGNSSKFLGVMANLMLPIWFKLFPSQNIYYKNRSVAKQKKLIVCLTSFPARINKIWLVVECLLRQSCPPTKIILYLSKEQFPSLDKLPAQLLKYRESCLEIKLVEGDLRSHKKYWYALTDYSNSPIITVDDDIIYSSDTLNLLCTAADRNPHSVIGLYCSKMKWDDEGNILPYSQWSSAAEVGVSRNDIFFGSGGGTYFPAGSLNGANQPWELIQSVCPLADDIWLNAFIRKNGYKVYYAKKMVSVPEWSISNNVKLCTINDGEKKNDIQLIKVQEFMMQRFHTNPFKRSETI